MNLQAKNEKKNTPIRATRIVFKNWKQYEQNPFSILRKNKKKDT